MRATSGSSRVMCDNVPGLVSHQRQLCHRHPDVMRAIGLGVTEWTMECQHQFRQHRWNCNTLDRDHSLFGRVLLRSKSLAFTQLTGSALTHTPLSGLHSPCPSCLAFCSVKKLVLLGAIGPLLQMWAREIKKPAQSFGGGWSWVRVQCPWLCYPCPVTTLPVPPGSDFVSRRKGSSSHRALLTFKLFFLGPDPSRRI